MKIMIFGTFDLLHEGHKYFIQEASILGEELIVVIARDKTVLQFKGRLPLEHEEVRKRHIEELQLANRVILGDLKDHLSAVKKHKPDIIMLGYDQAYHANTLLEDLKNIGFHHTKVIRAKAFKPETYKTSILRDGSL